MCVWPTPPHSSIRTHTRIHIDDFTCLILFVYNSAHIPTCVGIGGSAYIRLGISIEISCFTCTAGFCRIYSTVSVEPSPSSSSPSLFWHRRRHHLHHHHHCRQCHIPLVWLRFLCVCVLLHTHTHTFHHTLINKKGSLTLPPLNHSFRYGRSHAHFFFWKCSSWTSFQSFSLSFPA